MKQKWNFSACFSGICLIFLILDSSLVLQGAQEGLDLCLKTVIPSLFPFIVITSMLTSSVNLGSRYLGYAAGWLGIPDAASSVVIPAFLGGYPVGAKCVHDLYRNGNLEKKQAERLLAFCSNAGPSFLFGMVSGFFPEPYMVWILWIIHIASALMTAALFQTVRESKYSKSCQLSAMKVPDVLPSSMKAMGLICCWVILFRIMVTFLEHWCLWLLPQWLQVLITGLLELTNGFCELSSIERIEIRFVLSSCMLAFGGVCVLMQTRSVTGELSLKFYIMGKIIQTGFSLLLSGVVLLESGWVCTAVIPVILFFFRKIQKSCGNPDMVPV